ncbi:hypothetical protein C4566_02140, partial [Candidatus Parcubacteria bacterium]
KNKEKFLFSYNVYKNQGIWKIIFGVTIIYFAISLSPLKDVLFNRPNVALLETKRNILSLIDNKATVTAEAAFLPQLSSRPVAHTLFYAYFGKNQFAARDFIMPEVDYILVDYAEFLTIIAEKNSTGFLQPFKEKMPENWRKVIANYSLVKAKDNVYLWQNKNLSPETDLPLYQVDPKPSDLVAEDFLLSSSFEDINGFRTLKIDLQKIDLQGKELFIRFYQGKEYYDMSLDYGLWPVAEWSDNTINTFYYYPGDGVDSFEIFSWYGTNKLGGLKDLVVDKKIFSLSDKITF